MRRKQMQQLLEERSERILLLEARIENLEQLVDGFRAREQSIIDTLRTAHDAAGRTRLTAEAEAQALVTRAREQADTLTKSASTSGVKALAEAEKRAEEIVAAAQEESERILMRTRGTAREYEELFASFNAVLERNAVEAQETAARYAAFIRERRVDAAGLDADASELIHAPAAGKKAENLPDPTDDPARLMRNIYAIQGRDVPAETESEQAAMETPAAEPESLPDGALQIGEAYAAPQADDSQSFDAEMGSDIVPDMESEARFDAAFEDEPREWEPEAEHDGDAEAHCPTVGDLMPDDGGDDDGDVSLDDLLDEIIKASES